MAIHRIVMYSPDRRWRVTADPAGTRFRVEHDLVLQRVVPSLHELQRFLAEQNIALADMITD